MRFLLALFLALLPATCVFLTWEAGVPTNRSARDATLSEVLYPGRPGVGRVSLQDIEAVRAAQRAREAAELAWLLERVPRREDLVIPPLPTVADSEHFLAMQRARAAVETDDQTTLCDALRDVRIGALKMADVARLEAAKAATAAHGC